MIIALAGRRIDAPKATPRFPLQNVPPVRERIRALLESNHAICVVSSAACGADLIALAEAGAMGLKRRVILPFPRAIFREKSVTDRPGDWGRIYDRVLAEVEKAGDLIELTGLPESLEYAAANIRIIDDAQMLGRQMAAAVSVAIVWDGQPRGAKDTTQELADEAKRRGLPVLEVSTL